MITVSHVHELSGDAQLLPGFANASFQHCIDMQLITDFPENIRFGFALESETRCPSRHTQPWYLGQRVIYSPGTSSIQYMFCFFFLMFDNRSTGTDLGGGCPLVV